GYTHQGWLDWNNGLFYVNDEGDERSGSVDSTTTYVFDVSDIYNPVLVSAFTNGVRSIDHNLVFRDGFVFEANYMSGLRIYDARLDPIAPVEVGYVDTYPAADANQFNGAWGVYAGLPSGTILVGDIDGGLFVIDPADAMTLPPDAFALAAPADAAFVLPAVDDLSWEPSYAAVSTALVVSADPTLANPVVDVGLEPADTSFPIADLGLATCATWYWGLTAHNLNGDTDSEIRSFSIGAVGDLVADGTVDAADLRRFKRLAQVGNLVADLDGNGVIDAADRAIVIGNQGVVCP
ncbi:MAG: choice-of-anchor B family protein, partial [Deltaproteobacteria bacterium]|nr:choice-of-anchor B family protein [Deltaproteobacteria bacterium]